MTSEELVKRLSQPDMEPLVYILKHILKLQDEIDQLKIERGRLREMAQITEPFEKIRHEYSMEIERLRSEVRRLTTENELLYRKFDAHVSEESGLHRTEMIIRDVSMTWVPFRPEVFGYHTIDLGYAENGDLVGIAVWDLVAKSTRLLCPACLGTGEVCNPGESAHPSNWVKCARCKGTGKA